MRSPRRRTGLLALKRVKHSKHRIAKQLLKGSFPWRDGRHWFLEYSHVARPDRGIRADRYEEGIYTEQFLTILDAEGVVTALIPCFDGSADVVERAERIQRLILHEMNEGEGELDLED